MCVSNNRPQVIVPKCMAQEESCVGDGSGHLCAGKVAQADTDTVNKPPALTPLTISLRIDHDLQ